MNNQEIINKAPEGATHIDAEKDYFKFSCQSWMYYDDQEDDWFMTDSKSLRLLADINLIVELEQSRDEKIIERLKEDALVMANARRLIKANVRTSNGRLYSEIFGTGCGSGRQGSRNLGLDPDGNKTRYSAMCSYIDKEIKAGIKQ
jgi:hypothetical protein